MTTPAPRTQHPYFMYDAIVGQPDAIRTVIATQRERCGEVAAVLATKRRIYVVGIGTSWHAALAGASIMDAGPGGIRVQFLRVLRGTAPRDSR